MIQGQLNNGKLADIVEKPNELVVTCPNEAHTGGCEAHPDCHIVLTDTEKIPYLSFHCFGCGISGNFVYFVALCFNTSIEKAEKWLIANYGKQTGLRTKLNTDIIVPTSMSPLKKVFLDEQSLNQYQSWCPYLAKRKIARDVCTKFKIKYDPILRQIVFPIYDEHSNLVMLAKRSIDTKFFSWIRMLLSRCTVLIMY